MSNIVYIATSLDRYISDKNDGLEWLEIIPNPNKLDFGWDDFMNRIDAMVMGRKTFEKVCSFDCDWSYTKPVFVLSSSLKSLSEEYKGKAEIIKGPLSDGTISLRLPRIAGANIRGFGRGGNVIFRTVFTKL